jgi:hypothetical protein
MYTLYIDESGDPSTRNVRTTVSPGATPYMVLGAVLVKNDPKEHVISELENIKSKINKKTLHCSDLNHFQKRYFAKKTAELDVTLFGVISLKATLRNYRNEIGDDFSKYYHKCLQYLLENFCIYSQSNEIDKSHIDIVVERSNNFKVHSFRKYISKIQNDPNRRRQSQPLLHIDPQKICDKPKNDEPVLQYADLVAHSIFQCVDSREKNYGIKETSYLNDLKSKFYSSTLDSSIVGHGIKAVYRLEILKLDRDVFEFLNNLKAYGS